MILKKNQIKKIRKLRKLWFWFMILEIKIRSTQVSLVFVLAVQLWVPGLLKVKSAKCTVQSKNCFAFNNLHSLLINRGPRILRVRVRGDKPWKVEDHWSKSYKTCCPPRKYLCTKLLFKICLNLTIVWPSRKYKPMLFLNCFSWFCVCGFF